MMFKFILIFKLTFCVFSISNNFHFLNRKEVAFMESSLDKTGIFDSHQYVGSEGRTLGNFHQSYEFLLVLSQEILCCKRSNIHLTVKQVENVYFSQ